MADEAASNRRPTIADLTGDHAFAQTARAHWLTKKASKASREVIEQELWTPLYNDGVPYFSLLLLEQLQALERYLWPGYSQDSSDHHVLLLALLINTKRQEHLPVWPLFAQKPDEFSSFFRHVLSLTIDRTLSTTLRTHLLVFVVSAFQSLDSGIVRRECAPLVSIGIWQHLHSDTARERCLAQGAQLQKAWRIAGKKLSGADGEEHVKVSFERSWLYTLLLDALDKLYDVEVSTEQKQENVRYCETFLELLADLLSQLPTRRYLRTLLQDLNLLPAIRLSPLYDEAGEHALLHDLYQLLLNYNSFPIDDHSGHQLTRPESDEAHNARIARLQKVALQLQPEKLKILILANYASLSQRDELISHLHALSDDEILQCCQSLGLRTTYPEKSLLVQDRAFYIEILTFHIERKPFYTDGVRHSPILPTEQALYERFLLRTDNYDGSRPLAIPKLNLHYLSVGDFLGRSFTLYLAEAFYEIRKHLEETIKRVQPRRQQAGGTTFEGFSRNAIPIPRPAIIETLPPNVGQDVPAEVKAEVILDVSRLQPGLRREWEALKPDDVVFLLAVQPVEIEKRLTNGHAHRSDAAAAKVGLKTLRCAEVSSVLDENGRALRHDRDTQDSFPRPRQRRLLLRLDAATYKLDKDNSDAGKGDVYESINVIVRRKARENTFKAVLESLRQLALSDIPLPSWLQDVFLGFGDPASASYKRLPNRLKSLDYRDTFLDWQHLVESLPGQTVEPDPSVDASFPPPYILESTFTSAATEPKSGKKRRRDEPDGPSPASKSSKVTTYTLPNTGPYPTDIPKTNSIRFTPSQIEAITSGTQPGLTLIVGPPGTGKTDVTIQIVSNIYHNFPQQRTLLIAHSNQALNQLFQKIVALDIDERHLLRLGHGEEELQLQKEGSFSKAGRVESFLHRGAALLAEVQRLADSLGLVGAHGNSCETAEYFQQVYLRPLWRRFWDVVESASSSDGDSAEAVVSFFPFHTFFANAPRRLFPPEASREQALQIAKGCERHLGRIFDELADIRPFEILRSQKDKANYLLVKEARIIAMTATHAAMRRQEIARLGFRYENVVVEEAAQMIEVEGFIPLVLQDPKQHGQGDAGLQRIVLVGDHLQNSPVVQNAAYRSYANMEQSLFQRLIRLGVPHILLDAQGRSRPSLAALVKWRYPHLTNLPFTSSTAEFTLANAGLRHEFQFIDVQDYKGKGESEPSAHWLQNLGEAEYAVALYQYMRLLGYPARKISILAAYAGQAALMKDVLALRCKGKRLFGLPAWVGTVDKYQGEQNDYIILSLVRTKALGFLRDLRRLTVAWSRARLGLYVFGRRDVFERSLELREVFELFTARSDKLALVTGELFPTPRLLKEDVGGVEMQGVEHLGQYVFEMAQAKVKMLRESGGAILPPDATTGEEDGEGEEEGEEEDGGVIEDEGEEEDAQG